MPSFRNASDLNAIFVRLDRLTETMSPTWGRFTPARMLAHMSDSCRMALGELAVKPMTHPVIGSFPFKQLIIYLLPFPKNSPTAPEIIARTPEAFDVERAQLRALIARLDGHTGSRPHPLFGQLSNDEWGVLGYRHLDHHLRQFGV